MSEQKYLELLSKSFINVAETTEEIINLQAILNLPKATEHFLTDLHGEYEAFSHVLRNGSGTVKEKIERLFGDRLTENEIKELSTVIFYPEEKINLMEETKINMDKWYSNTLSRLIEVARRDASKYTRSKVRKAMPKEFQYILQELIYENKDQLNKKEYLECIIDTIISVKRAKHFIVAISNLIKRLNIDKLHIIGDIYDRGPSPHLIMDVLENYHNVDIQWGNHDMLWMGAALGNKACIANAIRISCRYNNNDVLEEAYGINLLPLATFAMKYYSDDKCKKFRPKEGEDSDLVAQMHKAITIIQFKVEGLYSERNPGFNIADREILKDIDFEKSTVKIDGAEYKLNDDNFPTINKNNPLELTEEEAELLDKLKLSFIRSERLQRHNRLLFTKGSMFLKYNSNLMYHGCIPLKENGEFQEYELLGEKYKGIGFLEKCEEIVRRAYLSLEANEENKFYRDFIWYLWCGKNSPLFGKDVMRTFERYFIDDKSIHKENKNPYYNYTEDENVCNMILEEFGLNPKISHIINGHVPVKVKKGESPIKANGKLLVIDGGLSKAYQETTGIAGYTLIYNSIGMYLVSHAAFKSRESAIKEGSDILSYSTVVDKSEKRLKVKDTDIGKELQNQINDLKKLLNAYLTAKITPRDRKN